MTIYEDCNGNKYMLEVVDTSPEHIIVNVQFPNGSASDFTANSECREWGFCGEDNWTVTEEFATKAGMRPGDLFPIVEPMLNDIVGW